MKYFTIAENVTIIASKSTIKTIKKEMKDLQAERAALDWLEDHDPSDTEYSYLFKDLYGFRPRW